MQIVWICSSYCWDSLNLLLHVHLVTYEECNGYTSLYVVLASSNNHFQVPSPIQMHSILWLLFVLLKFCATCEDRIIIYVFVNLHKIMGTMVISMLNNGEIMNLKGVG